ncbi:MAG: BREX-1 system adenine-specific DNA-methyltransferase PglX [Lachnospira sp.]
MNKTAIKNFAIWARNKLIADVKYRAGLLGVTENGIANALPQSTGSTEFYDIGTAEPFAIHGSEIEQRRKLVEALRLKEKDSNYQNAYKYILEEVAYTWFNRLIAVRFMEVNDYLPAHIRVLSSESGKMEPDIVTNPFDAELCFTPVEEEKVIELKQDNKLDELFRMLFIKQCNALNDYLPALFEKTNHYTELLLNLSFIDKDGVVYHLVNDIDEADFNVELGGQVEIIGWLYQYYNTEPKNEAFAKNGKITKDEIPAVTQLFTPDWIVRYMVENSLGRLWLEGHPNDALKSQWKYYLDEAVQEPEVQAQLDEIKKEHAKLNPEDIKLIDPCMGSGHILVYAFDVFMQIYESAGWSQRDAAKSILENNIYGLDIDDRAGQMAYFAVMMKARQYNRRILSKDTAYNVFAIQESNGITSAPMHDMGVNLSQEEYAKASKEAMKLVEEFHDAKEYGSIINVEEHDWELLKRFAVPRQDESGQMALDIHGEQEASERIQQLIKIGKNLAQKYEVVITNPPYMGSKGMNSKLSGLLQKNYPITKYDLYSVFIEKCIQMTKKHYITSMITQNSWMAGSRYEMARQQFLNNSLINMVHLGTRAFDEIGGEVVQTVTFCFGKNYPLRQTGTYVKLTDVPGENEKRNSYFDDNRKYYQKVSTFLRMPSFIIAYWVSNNSISILQSERPIEEEIFFRQGMATSDNERFLKQWREVSCEKIGFNIKSREESVESGMKWFPYNKGGSFRKWYGNNDLVVNWENDGQEMKEFTSKLPQGTDVRLKSKEYYFKEGFTWSALASSVSVRYCPTGFIFDTKGSMGFPYDKNLTMYYTGLINSCVSDLFLRVLAPTLDFNLVSMKQIPLKKDRVDEVTTIVMRNIELSKKDWDMYESSWNFELHPLMKGTTIGRLISDKYKEWEEECNERFNQLKANEEELNRIFIDIYGLQEELSPEIEDKDVTVRKADIQRDIKSLVSYAVGCMFGRYSLDIEGLAYAGGEWDASKYTSYIPDDDNVIPITDEEYLEDDIVTRFCDWLKIVYGEDTLEENLDYIAKALGNKGDTSRAVIRNYFLTDFFKDHCQTYSVTGSGKRPIYWLFDSGKQNGFKALVYLHRYNADTIGNLRVEYLHKMQRVYESEINRMQDTIDHSTNSREVATATKRKEKLTKQLKECRDYDEKIGHLALERIELDLDDGVKYNYRKVQTGSDGKFYEVLADSKSIMMDAKKYSEFKQL